ncbi:hypothetical protein F7725_002673 [Dissostichus mawsoni]|uniref:Polycomb group protein RNA binding region domain-containing protein n=1 Tax=Dissostichus mawsoni TaxID=36200 RepID=A0A7J5Y301_DISMA|nr:hypothetical protein F7725_002673 [Dissostichus mawsoni]
MMRYDMRSVVPMRVSLFPGAPAAPPEPVRPGMKLEAVDKKNPYLICPGNRGRGEGRRGVRDVRRLERSLRLLVPLRVQRHVPRGLVFPHYTACRHQGTVVSNLSLCGSGPTVSLLKPPPPLPASPHVSPAGGPCSPPPAAPPMPPLPVRKGVRGRRPKSETLALLRGLAEAKALNTAGDQDLIPDLIPDLETRLPKKRGPKPGSKLHPQPRVLLSSLQSQAGGGGAVRVRTDGGVRVVRLPSASSASFVLRFLENMCRHLQCDSLFSSQPFSLYHRKSVKQEALEAPSGSGGKRSLSGSPPRTLPPSPPNCSGLKPTPQKDQRFMDSASVTPRPPTPAAPPDASPPPPQSRGQAAPPTAASSTTGPEVGGVSEGPGRNPSCWSIEEVMQFVREADPAALAPRRALQETREFLSQ